jgi:hypothetical protein
VTSDHGEEFWSTADRPRLVLYDELRVPLVHAGRAQRPEPVGHGAGESATSAHAAGGRPARAVLRLPGGSAAGGLGAAVLPETLLGREPPYDERESRSDRWKP